MMILDRDIERAHALVIDGNPASRSIVASQLRDLGVGQISQVMRLSDGRNKIESRRYDIVVCEQHFPGEEQTGQDLLDDLRRANLLAYGTVFVMLTGEARFSQVAEAAESALDCYLLKPYSANTLAERLRQARHRKRVLGPVFAAVENDQVELGAKLCIDRFAARGEFWLYAARVGAELLLRCGRPEMAGKVYASVLAAKPVPWARLGVARALADAGRVSDARRALEELLAAEPGFADAWDALGRVQIDQGRFDEALASGRQSVDITPGSVPRLQTQGQLAFYQGQTAEAIKALDRAVLIGISSKMFDHQSLVVLALARFRVKDAKGLQRCRENLEFLAGRDAASARLRRFCRVAAALDHLLGQRSNEALALVAELADERLDPGLDVEAGCNLMSLLAELAAADIRLDGIDATVEALAIRFSTSRSLSELLGRSAMRHAPFAAIVAQAPAQVMALTEQAMNHTVEGRPEVAVRKLLDQAERTLNARLVDTAGLTLQRHRAAIADGAMVAALEARIEALRERLAASRTAPRLGQGTRAAGGLTLRESAGAALRTGSPVPADAPAA